MKTQSTWRKFLENITSDVTLHAPALPEEVEKAESSLDVSFPDELKSLLQESNGIEGSYGFGLIWNIERITKDNLFSASFSIVKIYTCLSTTFCFLPMQETVTSLPSQS